MNRDLPPLKMGAPESSSRRKEKGRLIPTDPAIVAGRRVIAERIRAQLVPLSDRLRGLPDDQRKAIFLKLAHEGPLSLDGTGLKPIAQSTDGFTLALPKEKDLSRYLTRVGEFESAPIKKGTVPSARQVGSLQAISEGSPFDRVSSGLLANYAVLIQQESVLIEIELTSYASGPKKRRRELEDLFLALQTEFNGGQHGATLEHEEVDGTRRAVIRCTGRLLQKLVEDRTWQLGISWFEPRPEFQTFRELQEQFAVDNLGPILPPPADAPVVCVIDSGVSAGNPFLRPVVRPDLLRSFLPNNLDPSDEYGHGSGVASLASYYALNLAHGATNEGKCWIAGARILDRNNELQERLFSKVVGDVVAHYAPLNIKIFNLSVNVRNRTWNNDQKRTVPRNSWIARSLDRLAREFDVVFVVSTGNLTLEDINAFARDGQHYPDYFMDLESGLLDPAQSALSLTVGSCVATTLIAGDQHAQPLASNNFPGPVTRLGPGISGETKPDVVDRDGNVALDRDLGRVRHLKSLKVPTASNALTPAITWDVGTSYAAARVTHKVARILADLRAGGIAPSAVLLKALLINSATPGADEDALEDAFSDVQASAKARANVCGMGMADADRATFCDDHQVVLFYQGNIKPDLISFFQIPVPRELMAAAGQKRLTVSVCFHPEVQRWGLERYLGTTLKWRMFRGNVAKEDVISSMSSNDDDASPVDDLPIEIPFRPRIVMRSRGTVQHAVHDWTQARPEYADNHYTLAVAAYNRWGRAQSEIPYAVVVRLEDVSRTVHIYARISAALIALEVRAEARS